jgi:hypothetical protein
VDQSLLGVAHPVKHQLEDTESSQMWVELWWMTSPGPSCHSVIADRDRNGGTGRALLKTTTPRAPLVNVRHLLVIARVMDGRGVVPTLSSSDVETAAQVLHLLPSPLASCTHNFPSADSTGLFSNNQSICGRPETPTNGTF